MGKKYFIYYLILVSIFWNIRPVFPQTSAPVKPPVASVVKMGDINPKTSRIDYMEFREVDIKDILRQLAKQYTLNIVFSESVSGVVTVQLHDVTIDEALDAIISVNGFVYTRKQNVLKVTTSAEAEKEGKQTRVFRLNNADAVQLTQSLQKVISADGSIQVDARSNSLIVTDIPRIINDIENMISENLDSRTKQVLIEARFIEASVGTSEKIGVDWTPSTNMMKITGSSRSTTLPFSATGVDDSLEKFLPAANSTSIGDTMAGAYGFPYTGTSAADTGTAGFSYGSLDFSGMQMVMNFIKSSSDAKVISSPRIVTVDNKEARIQVGKTVRIATDKTVDSDTNDETYTYEKTDVGIILTVTPHITPDNYVRLSLKPEVSSLNGTSADGIDIVSKSVAETEVIIGDGRTIVIGGLIESSSTNDKSSIPVLGDIPLVGKFFSYKNPDKEKKELLIFVTARIVSDNERGAMAYKSGIITSPPRHIDNELRDVKLLPKKRHGKK